MRGGVERVLDNLVGIWRKDHEIAIFTSEYRPMGLFHLDSATKFLQPSGDRLGGGTNGAAERERLIHLVREVKRWAPDVVVLNKSCGFAGWMSQQFDIPLVTYVHDLQSLTQSYPRGKGMPALQAKVVNLLYRMKHHADVDGLLRRGLGKTRLAICPSDWLAKEVKATFPHTRCITIPNGVDHSFFVPTWEDNGYVFSAGRLTRDKKYELAIDAAITAGQRIVICGATGQGRSHTGAIEYAEALRKRGGKLLRLELDVSDNDYLRFLQGCSVFLCPGLLVELGFALAPMEAMACGKPVLASKRKAAEDSRTESVILLNDDPADWSRELRRLMDSSPLRKKLGEIALEASFQYTWEKTASRVLEALISIARPNATG